MLEPILREGIICAVGKGVNTVDQAKETVEAIIDGGMMCIEIMQSTPDPFNLIEKMREKHPGSIFGMGTVMDIETAYRAIKVGAQFLVSPYLNLDLIKFCKHHGVVSCFGALTPTEVMQGWKEGLDLVKVFPTMAMGGPKYIEVLKGTFQHMRLVGAGGVRLEDVGSYFKSGASLVAVDEDLMNPDKIGKGEFQSIKRRAEEYRASIDLVKKDILE